MKKQLKKYWWVAVLILVALYFVYMKSNKDGYGDEEVTAKLQEVVTGDFKGYVNAHYRVSDPRQQAAGVTPFAAVESQVKAIKDNASYYAAVKDQAKKWNMTVDQKLLLSALHEAEKGGQLIKIDVI